MRIEGGIPSFELDHQVRERTGNNMVARLSATPEAEGRRPDLPSYLSRPTVRLVVEDSSGARGQR